MMLSGISKPNPWPKLPVSLDPLGKCLMGLNPWLQLGKLVCLAGHLPSHGRCSPSSMCKVPHLAQVYNTHSQLSSGQATGLALADIGNLVTVSPRSTSPGINKTSGDSGSPIGTPLVLGKAPCLAQTSISSSLQLSPSKAVSLADGINTFAACCPPVTCWG